MKVRSLLVAAAVAATTFIASPAAATINVVSDGLYDNGPYYRGEGDINAHGSSYEDDTITVSVQSRIPTNPATDPNWVDNATSVIWDMDVNGDGQADYWAIVSNFLGVTATVYRESDWERLCDGTPGYISEKGVVVVSFPASCIGTPSGFSLRTWFHYNTGSGQDSYDFAPDSGFGAHVTRTVTQPAPEPEPQPSNPAPTGDGSGYWMIDFNGGVYNFGGAKHFGSGPVGAADIEPTPSGNGYWMLSERGEVHNKGDAAHYGNATVAAGEKAASLSASPTGHGYWVFTDAGRVLTFGDAAHVGDMAGVRLNGPVLDSVATPSGDGYYMVASDGGVFTFGDAKFSGSTGGMRLNKPVMSMAPDSDGSGYWLVASDGGIFAFDATFHGSMGATKLNKPVSGIVPGRNGYLMVGEDGGIFAFGDVKFHGSLGANPPPSPVVAVALKTAG